MAGAGRKSWPNSEGFVPRLAYDEAAVRSGLTDRLTGRLLVFPSGIGEEGMSEGFAQVRVSKRALNEEEGQVGVSGSVGINRYRDSMPTRPEAIAPRFIQLELNSACARLCATLTLR